ncbi:MAG TPA: GNAT family N-acetyltransferase [Solirubrobacteraceae bacterium]|nr:GNAT family N-acetyltransferase [Solirubrobacteraceae bacterium]
MRWEAEPDLHAFDVRVRPLLEARIENNVPATVLTGMLQGQHLATPPVLAVGVGEDGMIAAAALRTPPWLMLCTPVKAGDAAALLDLWLEHDPDLPGVNALSDTARTIAADWTRRTGGSERPRTAMALHSLRAVVDPPRPAGGRLAMASAADRDLCLAWWDGFVADSHVIDAGREARTAMVDHRIAQGHMFLWVDGGRPVSLVAINPPTAGVIRIGPVYTPPSERRRGYATSAVAAVSRLGLEEGAHTCMLYTDVANPTSNKIYADVGYRRIGEWEERVFTAPSAGPSPGPV